MKTKLKNRRKLLKQKFFKKCPNGGYCINPICAFGCVD